MDEHASARLADLFESADGQEGARKRAFAAPVWISIGVAPALKEDGPLLPRGCSASSCAAGPPLTG